VKGVLGAAIKKVYDSDDYKEKMDDSGLLTKYMDQKTYNQHWDEIDILVKPIIPSMSEQPK
jgi:hypothetical protein